MSKIAAAGLLFLSLSLFSIPMSAQLIPHGNVYAGVSYSQSTYVVPPTQSYRGWNASGEFIPFVRFPHLGFTLDASGFYRSGLTQYNAFLGPRLSITYGKWRPFVHAMGGIQKVTSTGGNTYKPAALDFGGGIDYKLPFKNFSWRVQGDYMRTHYASFNQNDYRASTGIVWRF